MSETKIMSINISKEDMKGGQFYNELTKIGLVTPQHSISFNGMSTALALGIAPVGVLYPSSAPTGGVESIKHFFKSIVLEKEKDTYIHATNVIVEVTRTTTFAEVKDGMFNHPVQEISVEIDIYCDPKDVSPELPLRNACLEA